MGLLDIGGSKSESSSRSQSTSFDNLDSFGFNFGAQGSESGGGSTSRIAFEDVFAQLFGGASGAAAGIDTGAITGAANSLFSSGAGFLDTLTGGGAGAGHLEDRLARGGQFADDQIDLLGEDISKFLAEDVNPAITAGGVNAMTLGGSRGDLQRGLASEAALKEFSRGSLNIRRNEQSALDKIATDLAADEQGRNLGALGMLPGLFGLAESGAMANLSPFAALSQILGGPTVLQDSNQFASSFGFDFGEDRTTGRAGSQSTSRSDSESGSFNLGFG